MELKTFISQDISGNVLPMSTCYLYVQGTLVLASGLQDSAGTTLSNPWTTDARGLVQVAAPDGIYDLRVVNGAKNYRMRVQFSDVQATVRVADLGDANDPAKGSAKVGHDGGTVKSILDKVKPFASYAELSSYSGQASAGRFIGANVAGDVYRDDADTTSSPNGLTIFVDASGRRWKRPKGRFNVMWAGAKGDGIANDTAAIQAAASLGVPLLFPKCPDAYLVNAGAIGINLLNGADLLGEGCPTIRAIAGSNGRIFRMNGLSGITIKQIKFDGNKAVVTGNSGQVYVQDCDGVDFLECKFVNACGNISIFAADPASRSCKNVKFRDCELTDSAGTSVDFVGVYRGRVINCTSEGHVGFGWRLSGGSNRCLLANNNTVGNGIESIGVTYDCYRNRIIGNHAEACGDNGISITGYSNVVNGNLCLFNKYNGIELYGKMNTATGNVINANGQVHNPSSPLYNSLNVNTYAGIAVVSGWGGVAQYNSVAGNNIDDDQSAPTQEYGVKLGAASYSVWAGSTVVAADTYVRSGNNVYYTSAGGTTGTTSPAHTSGSVSDGGVTWKYITYCFGGTSEALGNTVGPNTVGRFVTAVVGDFTINQSNMVASASSVKLYGSGDINRVTAGFSRRATAWAFGQAVAFGTIRYNPNTSQTYICVNAGGTTSIVPTHLSGTVIGADGIAWRYHISGQYPYQLPINPSDVSVNVLLQLLNLSDGITYVGIIPCTGSPEGVIAGTPGSIAMNTNGGAGETFYVKESGTGTTGWVAK